MVRPGFKQTEVGEIPEDWDVVPLPEVALIEDGDRGSNYPSKKDLMRDGYCLFLNAGNVTKFGFEFDVCEFISKVKDKGLNKGKLFRGDIVLTTRGTVGNFAHFDSSINFEHIRINSGMVIIRNKREGVDHSYLYSLLRSNIVGRQINTLAFGSAQPQLTVKGIITFNISIPRDESEQKVIAKALSDVDELIVSLEKLIAKKRDIKTATMQQLLTGKKRLPGFGKGKGYKQTELGEVPEDWDVKSYGEIFLFLTTASNSRDDLSDSGNIFYVHYGDIHTKFDFLVDFSFDQVPKIESNKLKGAAFIQDGDLIMADASEDYEGVGKSIEVKGLKNRKAISGLHTLLLRDIGNAFAPGFRGYLHSIAPVKKSFDRLATGLKVYGLSKNSLKQVLVPVPHYDEQKAIMEVLNAMESDIELFELRLNKTKSIKQGMMQELLTGRTRLVDVAETNKTKAA